MITYAVLFQPGTIKSMTGKVFDQALVDEIVQTVGKAVKTHVGGKIYEVCVGTGKMRQKKESGAELESNEKSVVVWVEHDADPDEVYNEISNSLNMIFNEHVISFGGDRDSMTNGKLVIE